MKRRNWIVGAFALLFFMAASTDPVNACLQQDVICEECKLQMAGQQAGHYICIFSHELCYCTADGYPGPNDCIDYEECH